ncbi:hypothetical protein BJX70DRAFT_37519 [Aspergillus crustosus]
MSCIPLSVIFLSLVPLLSYPIMLAFTIPVALLLWLDGSEQISSFFLFRHLLYKLQIGRCLAIEYQCLQSSPPSRNKVANPSKNNANSTM